MKWHCRIGVMCAEGTYRYLVARDPNDFWVALYHQPDADPGCYSQVPGRFTMTRREAMNKVEEFDMATRASAQM